MLAPELLLRYPFFDFLTLDRLKAIARISKEESYARGTLIFRENERAEGLYILEKGNVDLFFTVEVEYHPELHKELLFGVINPGEFFGISALIEPHILTSSARASSFCQVIIIDAVELLALCDRDGQLAYGLMHQIAKASIERLNATHIQLATAWSSAKAEE
jgi:CRP-like cAMP-binding protein